MSRKRPVPCYTTEPKMDANGGTAPPPSLSKSGRLLLSELAKEHPSLGIAPSPTASEAVCSLMACEGTKMERRVGTAPTCLRWKRSALLLC